MNPTNRKWISQIVACSFLAMLPAGAYAQSKTIHGVVKDANGETIIGASVGQKGTKNATVTNLDGEFSISVPDNAVLEISYIGYNNQRVAVNGKSSLEIVMTEDVHKLNELVVVGYGVMKKKDLTGAVGSLAAKDMENSPVANIGQAIQGKIAGLQVVDAGKPGEEGEIEFRNVSFAYPDSRHAMLEGVNFKAKKGQTVAFIGSTGSGKSSLINLVPRFYDATQGEVLVDGVNVRDYKLKALRDKIGYVPQQSFLFKGTIASNVAYGDTDRDDDTVRRACDVAQATEFIDKKQKKYDSGISQGGSNVSGGQKQRLSIARAVYRHPEILIFDDSFSALDFKTDRAVRDALEKEAKDSTKLIVAQRIGTIMNADRIIVLDDGKVVGQGTHEELLDTCEVYRQIAESQLSEDELKR